MTRRRPWPNRRCRLTICFVDLMRSATRILAGADAAPGAVRQPGAAAGPCRVLSDRCPLKIPDFVGRLLSFRHAASSRRPGIARFAALSRSSTSLRSPAALRRHWQRADAAAQQTGHFESVALVRRLRASSSSEERADGAIVSVWSPFCDDACARCMSLAA